MSDGQIVLVRRGSEVGAFVLMKQRSWPRHLDYAWYYRADGQGRFTAGDPAVKDGIELDAGKISFATFSIDWSINTDGKGWVHFSKLPTQIFKAADYTMCVTTETNIDAIDANDRRWVFRSRPVLNGEALVNSQLK